MHQLHPHAALPEGVGRGLPRDGLTIVGVETPEFAFEHDAGNVANAIGQFGLRYPVVQDNNMGTWNAYGNQYWPADYLIDAHGQVRYATFGEGDYDKTETAIRALLAEAGARGRAARASHGRGRPLELRRRPRPTSAPRARRAGSSGRRPAPHDYGPPPNGTLTLNEFAYSGTWKIAEQPATAVSDGRHRRRVPGQERLPRAQLAGRTAAAGAGAARRPPDRRRATPAPTSTAAS